MLLNELIQTDQREINLRDKFIKLRDTNWDDMNSMKDTPKRQVGGFSEVRPDQNDPFMVKKKQKPEVQSQKDAYPKFVEKMVNSDQNMNPYFPRIYITKKVKDPTNRALHNYTIEKLEKISVVSDDEFEHLKHTILTPKAIRASDVGDIYDMVDVIYDICVIISHKKL